jgi:GNAT superfamily N-acetyltransferase
MPTVRLASLAEIAPFREGYRRTVNAQIVHDSWHRRGLTTLYLLLDGSDPIGYGAVGGSPGEAHEMVKEFFLLPPFQADASRYFGDFLAAAGPRWLEAQTNDPILAPLLVRFAPQHTPHTYLFRDGSSTSLPNPGVHLRPVAPADHATVFAHTTEPIGDWGLEREGRLVATGGLFYHYNPPYGDLYMEVAPDQRRRGYASFLLQELKRLCYEGGHLPAARCGLDNTGSRRALERAGMACCGTITRGQLAA